MNCARIDQLQSLTLRGRHPESLPMVKERCLLALLHLLTEVNSMFAVIFLGC